MKHYFWLAVALLGIACLTLGKVWQRADAFTVMISYAVLLGTVGGEIENIRKKKAPP